METELKRHRKQASDQSLGSSHSEIYKKTLELLVQYTKENCLENHLDFGSGQGELLKKIDKLFPGSNLMGVDLMEMPKDLNFKCQWDQSDLNGTLDLPNASFQSITAIEVIEHLENPRHIFRELCRLLKKDGILILSTPNNESWRSIFSFVVRGHFVAFTDSSYPAHITALNRKDIARSALEAGFSIQQWSYIEKGCVPGLTQFTWQQISAGLLQGLRYSDNLFVVLQKNLCSNH